MSNLDHPISILIAEGGKISTALNSTGDNKEENALKLAQISLAICILDDEEKKDELEESEPIPYIKKL